MQIPRKMSAHNVMASISRTLGTRHSECKPGNEVKFAGEESKDKLYEPKHKQKLVRVLTVVAYIISVSLAAIVLSLYYTYIWDPSDHPYYSRRGLNATSTTAASTARTLCVDVTPSLVVSLPTTSTAARRNVTPADATSPLEGSSTEATPPSDGTSERGLLKTLTSPRSEFEDYPSSTDLPAMASISSEQFQAMPAGDERDGGTIEPAEDLMDE